MILMKRKVQKTIAIMILFYIGVVGIIGLSNPFALASVIDDVIVEETVEKKSTNIELQQRNEIKLLSNTMKLQQRDVNTLKTSLATYKEPVTKKEVKETKVTEPEVDDTYKYYEVLDFTDGNYYSMDKDLQRYTYDLCVKYEIEEHFTLILSQLYAESRYDAKAISASNDYGIAQINKSNHKWLKKELGITDFLDAKQGILANVYMMSGYLKEHDTVSKALSLYNTGTAYSSTSYSKRVLRFYEGVREIKK